MGQSNSFLNRFLMMQTPFLNVPCNTWKGGAKQELPQQNVGEKSLVEHSEHMTGKKLPPGEHPTLGLVDPTRLVEFARNKPRKNGECDAPEKCVCPQSECARALKTRNSLRKHLHLIHGPATTCVECGKAFPESSKLKTFYGSSWKEAFSVHF